MSSISRFPINFFQSSLISWRTHILKENTSNMMCTSLLQFSMVGFSVCISSRNLIIANFSRCVRSLFSETHLTLYFYLNVIVPSIAQASLHQNDWHIVDILRCQFKNYQITLQITSGLYQHDNTLTIDFKKNWSIMYSNFKKTMLGHAIWQISSCISE
jgi:hypothetical protein